ncbi:MAG: hypothetical protein L0Y54_09795 [Sporichthyaceae bacterium]|nr:hypothetical protein [Sporichthyaceae bacterium]
MTAALLTAAVAGLIGLAASLSQYVLVVAVLVLQVVCAYGWFRLAPVPSVRGSLTIAIAAGLAADVFVLLDRTHEVDSASVGPLAGVLGIAFVATFGHELFRADRLEYLVASVTSTAAGTTLTVLAAGLLAERVAPGGRTVLVTSMAAVAAATFLAAMPGPAVVRAFFGTAAGGAAGYGISKILDDLGSNRSLLLGASVGLMAAAATVVSAAARSSRRAVLSAAVMLPLAFAAPVTYVLGRMVVG